MKVLVTGSNGFIGSHLVERLVSDNYEVRCLVRPTSDLSYLKNLNLEFVYGDVTDPESLRAAVDGVDYVFHLGGLTKAPDQETYHNVNAGGTRNLLEACHAFNASVRRVVVVSSLAAGGPAEAGRPRVESDPDTPVTDYGRSKKAGDDFAASYAGRLPVTILRPPAVYGPRDKDVFIFFKLISLHLKPRIGFRPKYLTAIFVYDLVDAICLCANQSAPSGSVYYVDDGSIYTWKDFSDRIRREMQTWAVPLIVPETAVKAVGALADLAARGTGKTPTLNKQKVAELLQPSWATNAKKIRIELGYKSNTDLETGCRLTIDWYRREGWIN